jgi:type I restriction enzyme M protein
VSPRGARTGRASGSRTAGAGSPGGTTDPTATATTNLEPKLWASADMLRNNMDAAEYKHIVLGLIFLKYISDAFEAKHAELAAAQAADEAADPEDPDEYKAASIFWVPREARWSHLKAQAPQPTIGRTVDDAMDAIERENPALKGVLPKDFARPGLVFVSIHANA